MSQEQNDISKDFEDIVKKTIEINQQYFKEGLNLYSQLSNSTKEKKTINPLQSKLIAGAIASFAQLNLNHYKNMVDLGFQLSKKIINNDDATESAVSDTTNEENKDEPAFILRETGHPGSSVLLQFVLDNTKKEQVICTLENLGFVCEAAPNDSNNFKTTFTPQSFNLNPGESQTVKINVKIGAKEKPGNYLNKVQVLGFEPAHFLIYLSVVDKIDKSTKTVVDEQ